MILELIVILMSLLIPGIGIYIINRDSQTGNEIQHNINDNNNEEVFNDDFENFFNEDNNNVPHDNSNLNNNILNDNNENNSNLNNNILNDNNENNSNLNNNNLNDNNLNNNISNDNNENNSNLNNNNLNNNILNDNNENNINKNEVHREGYIIRNENINNSNNDNLNNNANIINKNKNNNINNKNTVDNNFKPIIFLENFIRNQLREEENRDQKEEAPPLFEWDNIENTAEKLKSMLKNNKSSKQEIIEILNRIKKEKGKEAVRQWLEKNKETNRKKTIDEIVGAIWSDENANIYKNTYGEIRNFIQELGTDYIGAGQNYQLLERQMKQLEREQGQKEQKEEEEEERKQKEREEERKKRIEYNKEAEIAKEDLGEEPDKNDPDAYTISFRLPEGEKNLVRRFLKTDKISMLYTYVKSIGSSIFAEPDSNDFDILNGFPPQTLKDKMNNTLESEGLLNSILQITEKKIS